MLITLALGITEWPMTAPAAEFPYSIPRTAPLYQSPPFEYRDCWGMTILFKTTAEVLKELVPEPLVPNPNSLMWIFIGRQNASCLGAYYEVILGVPVAFRGKPGSYSVYLYLDNDAAIAGGREIWGWPKKEARITMAERDGVVTATVERGGIQLVRAAMELGRLANPAEIEKGSNPVYFNFKLIPSVKKNAPPEVMQLTSTTLENNKVKQAYTGRATLEFGTSPVDPLQKIAIKEVLGATYELQDFDLVYGEVIYDYLKEGR